MKHLDTILLAIVTEVDVVVCPGVQGGDGGAGVDVCCWPAVVEGRGWVGEGGVVTTDGDRGGDSTGAFSIIILVITCLVTIRYLVLLSCTFQLKD